MRIRIGVTAISAVMLTSGFFNMDSLILGRGTFYSVALPWDRVIPLEPSWIWAYLLYYPICVSPLFFPKVLKNGRTFRGVMGGFLFQFALAWVVFYLFPTRIAHPAVPGSTLSDAALRGLYRVDDGHLIFPCLHVANTLFVALVSARLLPWRRSAPFCATVLLVAASTLLTKQHLIVDLPAGAFLGYLAYRWIARPALA